LAEYAEHYHWERRNQRIGNRLVEPNLVGESREEHFERRSRLGGLLNTYRRAVA
jgi:hypothetical protein